MFLKILVLTVLTLIQPHPSNPQYNFIHQTPQYNLIHQTLQYNLIHPPPPKYNLIRQSPSTSLSASSTKPTLSASKTLSIEVYYITTTSAFEHSLSPFRETHVSTEISTEIVHVSSTPVKYDPNTWIADLNLFLSDKHVLETLEWLNDNIIYAAQSLLKAQSKENILGWASTQCAK